MSGSSRGVKKEPHTPREQLSDVPLSDLLALRDRVGSREFSRVYHKEKRAATTPNTKKDKDKPPEFSSKKRPRVRPSKQPRRAPGTDPRFQERSGAFDPDSFERAYSFLDAVRGAEQEAVERELQGAREVSERDRLLALLERIKAQARAKRERATDRAVAREWRRGEREKVGQGKGRFFLKKSELRRLQLERRLGGASSKRKQIEKRRKRLEKRSRKGIPIRRDQEPTGTS